MMKRTATLLAVIFLNVTPWAAADLIEALPGKSIKGARGFDVEADLRNDAAPFAVRVAVDRKDRTYEKGELMRVTVKSQQDGYLYLLYKQADGSTKCLFPNLYRSDNFIRGGREIAIPAEGQGFKLRCNQPFGDELLVALISKRKIAVEQLGVRSLTRSVTTGIDLDRFARGVRDDKGMDVEGNAPAITPNEWAEHSVAIKTVDHDGRGGLKPQQRRIGLFIGISTYKDPKIRNLHICHKDAALMALAMKEHGKLDAIGLLVNEKATLENIQKVFRELKLKSNPGDEIFIYWSGHGATCADTGGDEKDGRDEFLIPYDGSVADITKTMVLDDALGRWIQELDGRKVCIILDACHSGGQATGKGLGGIKGGGELIVDIDKTPSGSIDSVLKTSTDENDSDRSCFKGLGHLGDGGTITAGGSSLDFFDSEYSRIKDIGQADATMLFSSASDEISAERRDGNLSVMTYFLVKKITGSSSLTLKEAYDYVKVEVPKYIRDHFPGRSQTPQLCPEGGVEVKLR